MRIGLKVIETIEQYLMGTLSNNEKTDFESQMNQNPTLKSQVDLQGQIMQGIQRMALKNATQSAYKSYKLQSFLTKAIVIAAIAGLITTGLIILLDDKTEIPVQKPNPDSVYNPPVSDNKFISIDSVEIDNSIQNITPRYSQNKFSESASDEVKQSKSDPSDYLPQQTFHLKTNTDSILETNSGIVIYIPANAFATPEISIKLIVQEALKPEDILYAGLNTITADGIELETGGMFFLDAYANGKRVDLIKPITIDIPSSETKTGMQLYEGVQNVNGELVWDNPKPLENFLNPVEITTLNFYPPDYEKTVHDLCYFEKEFLDSLYYSFACTPQNDCYYTLSSALPQRRITPEERDAIYGDNRPIDKQMTLAEANILCHKGMLKISDNLLPTSYFSEIIPPIKNDKKRKDKGDREEKTFVEDTLVISENKQIDHDYCKGINPASVKTIWNTDFNNTNLATKEFEERIPWIHRSCNNNVLMLYISNLDKNISTVDSMAFGYLSGEVLEKFKSFASRGDGRVEMSNEAAKKLADYYQKQQKANALALAQAQKDYWTTQQQMDVINNQQQNGSDNRSSENQQEIFKQEYQKNLCKIYEELNLNKDCTNPVSTNPLPPKRYTAQVSSLGWKNIDRRVMDATLTRQSTSFAENGRTSNITYNHWSIQIQNAEKYDRTNVYMIPSEFNSYLKLTGENGNYTYSLNADLNYQTIVLAWDENAIYFYKANANEGSSTIELMAVTEDEWRNEIRNSLTSVTGMNKELDYTKYMQQDQKRINENLEKQQIREQVEPIIFPCRSSGLKMVSETINSDEPARRQN